MSKPSKKWAVLIGLLLLTLILVWRAPAPETQSSQSIVKPVSRSTYGQADNRTNPNISSSVTLNERTYDSHTVDLFSSPPVKQVITQPSVSVREPTKRTVSLPFTYIGKLEKGNQAMFFVMQDMTLYSVVKGQVLNNHFKLLRVDEPNDELVWLYLPTNEIRKMSTQE